VSGNTIENISGAIINTATSSYTYGAGIYLQGAEKVVVEGNAIRQTHSGSVTFSQTLAPGAIGVTNQTIASITGNVIDQAGMFGIEISDPLVGFSATIGAASITGNTITNCQLSGINIKSRGRIAISNNTIDTTGLTSTGSGIRVNAAASTAYPDISITGNLIRNSKTIANIDVNWVDGLTVSGNVCDTSTVHGITVANSINATVSCNVVKNQTSRGIYILSTSSIVTLTGNTVAGTTGTSSEGIRLDAFTSLDAANFITGCAFAWAGSYAVLRGTQNSTAVSNSGSAETDLMTYVLPASCMTLANDSLRITAFGICANNANAKTLKVYFGATVLQTVSLTISQAGAWRIQAEMIATGSAAQRCFSQLVQGGTTTFVAAAYTSAAEASSAAITVKVTGTGFASSDITQDGMLVQFAKS
jgi:parallel beta-helix repeat protein